LGWVTHGSSRLSDVYKQKSHQKAMIFEFEMLLLSQNFDFGDNQLLSRDGSWGIPFLGGFPFSSCPYVWRNW